MTKVYNLTHWFLLISHFFWLPIPHMHLWFIKSWRSMNSQKLIHPWGIDHWSSTELSLLVAYSHCPQHFPFLHWYYLVQWKLVCYARQKTPHKSLTQNVLQKWFFTHHSLLNITRQKLRHPFLHHVSFIYKFRLTSLKFASY